MGVIDMIISKFANSLCSLRASNPPQKWTEDLNKHFFTKSIQIAKKIQHVQHHFSYLRNTNQTIMRDFPGWHNAQNMKLASDLEMIHMLWSNKCELQLLKPTYSQSSPRSTSLQQRAPLIAHPEQKVALTLIQLERILAKKQRPRQPKIKKKHTMRYHPPHWVRMSVIKNL